MDGLNQTGAANAARHAGYMKQFSHHYGKEDSGYSSFSTSFSAPENVSLVHCGDTPRQTGTVSQGPDPDNLQWTGTKPMPIVCNAAVMGNEEKSVLSAENNNNNGHDRKCSSSRPPLPPPRDDSFLAIQQHNNFAYYHTRHGLSPQDMLQRSIETKAPRMALENNHQETSCLLLERQLSNFEQAYSQTPFFNPSFKDTGFVPEKDSQTVEGAGNFTAKRVEKATLSNVTNSSSGITFDCEESQKLTHCLSLAHKQKPVLVSPRHPELPSQVTCVNARSQETAPYLHFTTTDTETFTGDSRPAKVFPGSSHASSPEDTKGQNHEVDYKFHMVQGYKSRQRSLSVASTRQLSHQVPGLNNGDCNGQSFCGFAEYSHIPKSHLAMTDSVQVRGQYSQRQMRNSTGSVGHRLEADNRAEPGNESSSHSTITAENTAMLHRLASKTTNAGRGTLMSANQKSQLSEGQNVPPGQYGGNQDLCRTFENKITQLRKCKSSSQLIDPVDLNQLNEESPDTSSSLINSSKTTYRNQVKHAQSKVLKETSFRRRDLQLSWPNRAKQKPTSRPGITHFQTNSLTDAAGDPTSPPSQRLHENLRVKPLDPQHQVTRIGGRKRLTLQVKKMYSSEPEKINQLGVECNPRKWEQAKSLGFSDVQGNNGIVTSRRQLFESGKASQVNLKQIQHEALANYFGRRRSLKPSATKLMSDQWQFSKPVQHKRLLESNCYQYSSCNPIQGSNMSQHNSAKRHWDNSSEILSVCSTRSHDHLLSQSAEFQRFPKWTTNCNVSEKLASTDNLLDQLDFVHFGRYARSKSFSLPQQNELDPKLDMESLRQIGNSNSPSRPSTARIKSATELNATQRHSESKLVNVALTKSRFERQRGKSLNELELTSDKPATRLSRSTDQLCCSDADSESTKEDRAVLELKRAPLPLPELPTINQNWIKLRRHLISSQTSQDETTVVYERSSVMAKPRSLSYSVESLHPISPSPHSPLRKSRAWTDSLSSQSGREDDVYFEDPSVKSVNSGSDLFSASENICIQSNPLQQHSNTVFESSREIAANTETEVTELTSGKNSLKTIKCVQKNPIENEVEHHGKDRIADVVSLSLCSESSVGLPLPAPVADVEVKAENTKAEVHQSNGKKTSEQLSANQTNTAVPPRMKTKSPDELRMQKLIKEVIDEDQSLADILDPNPTTKTIMDLVEVLFQTDTLVLEACQRSERLYNQAPGTNVKLKEKQDIQFPALPELAAQPKVPVKTNLRQDVNKGGDCPSDITEKKKELIGTIKYKLQKLQDTKACLHEDIKMNYLLGEDIEAWINDVCKPNEIQKYKTFIEDLDKVMNLLLCLSSRLVRVENALSKVNESTDLEEKQSLSERHQTLSRQHEGARGLKEHQDHRERVTFRILTNYLTEIQLQHCHHFVQMRKALLIKQKEVEERLRLTEEQLGFLENSL
ncbi:protein Shroom1-like isoform X1 [Mobula hypostoma]|uniref:protein Shroom1-like isoform X1 n=1 Tax=Mobula hypostoma TaxID=723540 RepID=UPI002FC27DF9